MPHNSLFPTILYFFNISFFVQKHKIMRSNNIHYYKYYSSCSRRNNWLYRTFTFHTNVLALLSKIANNKHLFNDLVELSRPKQGINKNTLSVKVKNNNSIFLIIRLFARTITTVNIKFCTL